MLFSGYISNVSKVFSLKSSPNTQAVFFTIMRNSKEGAKYIKCLTYSKSLINDLLVSNENNILVVESGYPDTSYSKDYVNSKTGKEGILLQHFLVTDAYVDGLETLKNEIKEPSKEEVLKIVEEKEEVKEFDWDWDLDTKETNTNEN